MLNKVMLIGRLGKDPELRYTQSGMPVTTMNIATDESYTDKDGNKVDKTEWHRVVVFQRAAENCANFLAKGSLVYVEGSLQTRKWQDQQGQDKYTTEVKAQRVQFLDRKGGSTENFEDENGRRAGQSYRSRDDNWGQGRREAGQPDRRDAPHPEDNHAFPSEGADMDGVPF